MADIKNSNILAKWLEGSLSEQEEQELLSSYDLEDLKYVIDDIDTWKLPERNVSKRLEELKSGIEQKKKRTRVIQMRRWGSIAASIFIVIGVYFVYKIAFASQIIHLETAINEEKSHALPDGSTIDLDGNTTLEYDKSTWEAQREIDMNGQALFDVVSGNTFVVKTDYGKIEVLGTVFNVKTGDQLLEVSCFEGLVRVTNDENKVELEANEAVRFDHGSMTEFTLKTNQPDWKMGYTEFNDIPLNEVITSLNSRYGSQIQLPSEYENQHFTGRFVNNDFEKAIKMVFNPIGISYTLGENNEVHF